MKKAGKDITYLSASMMTSEAQRLARCIERQIDAYYASYSPSVYSRTSELRNVVRPSARVDISPDGKTLTAYVEIAEAPGESVFDGGPSVDRVQAIDRGWKVKKDVFFRDWEHFGFQAGYEFIDKGIADFERRNVHKILVTRQQG